MRASPALLPLLLPLLLLLLLSAAETHAARLNLKEMLRKARQDESARKLLDPLREAARVLATDGAARRRFLQDRDYTLVNNLLSVITPSNPLELDAGELEPEFLPRATCEGAGPIEVCVALTIFFQNAARSLPYLATCHTVSIESIDVTSLDSGVLANPPEFGPPGNLSTPQENDWNFVSQHPFRNVSNVWVFDEEYLRMVRFQETQFIELLVSSLSISCGIPLKVVPSTIDTDPSPATPAPTGTLFFDLTTDLRTRAKYVAGDGTGLPSYKGVFFPPDFVAFPATFESGNVINYTWGLYGPETAEEDLSLGCDQKVNVTEISFSASGLAVVEISIGPFTVVSRPLDTELPAALNDPENANRDSAVGPISDILCDLTTTLGDLVIGLITNLTWATNPDAFLQLNETLPVEEALEPEETLFPLRSGSNLADLSDNFLTNLLGLFPDDSGFIGGADPTKAPLTDLLLSFADVPPIPEGEDPLFYIVDALFNSSLVSQIVPGVPIDVLEILVNVTGGSFNLSETDGRLETSLALEVQEGITAITVNVSLGGIFVTYQPRSDAPPGDGRFFLEQIRLIGPYTLQLPTFRLGDLNIEIRNVDLLVTFFGGSTLLDPEVPVAERGVFELILEDIPSFVLPSVTAEYTTGLASFSSVNVEWIDFWAEAAVLVPVDVTKFQLLELGPLLENILDCALSIFYETPRIAGFRVNGEAMGLDIQAAPQLDGLLVLLKDFLEAVINMFQGAIPFVVEGAVNTTYVNQELFTPWVCPRAVNVSGAEFYFNGTFWESAAEFINEDLFFTLMDAIFPKGDTPQTAPYNQILAEPAELIQFTNVPSANGLNITVEFVLTRVELGGFSPGNFTQFELLRINQTAQQFVETELDLGIPENPVFLHIDFELNTYPSRGLRPESSGRGGGRRARVLDADGGDFVEEDEDAYGDDAQWWPQESAAGARELQVFGTPRPTPTDPPTQSPTKRPSQSPTLPQPTTSPVTPRPTRAPSMSPTPGLVTGQAINRVRLEVNFESVYVLLDLWLRFYAFDIESTTLNETTSFSCWMGKLQPFGGPSAIAARLGEQFMRLECEYCTTPLIASLAQRFNNPQATSEFFDFVNKVLDYAAQALLNLFSEDEWAYNINNFRRTCAGLETEDRPSELGEFSEDLSSVMVFMGFTTVVLAGLGFTTCCCVRPPHEQKRGGIGGVGAADKKDPFPDRSGAGGPLAFLEQVDNKEHVAYELEHAPLFNHQSVPTWIRFFVPFLLLLNFVLFLIGHLGQAVSVSIVASVGGVPIELRDFQSISVIESAKLLLNSGGYFLAILIIGLSIVWPYLKILGMGVSWFLPNNLLGFHARGLLIKRLDQLGKWSLIELYFLLFIIIAFKVSVTSPENTFLPGGFYFLRLEITPQFSIYAFCTALVISLATSNLIGVYHEKIEKQLIHVLREPRKADDFPVSLTDFMFPVAEQRATLRMTGLSVVVLTVLCLASILLLLISASMPALGAETVGLAGFVTKLEGRSNVINYSLFTFFEIIYGGSSAGEIYLGTFFMLTVLVIPLAQLVGIMYMLLGRFTLRGSINVYEVNQFLCSWACVEVFVVGIAVVILEVGQISGGIAGGACEFLREPMETYILPLGLVDEVDVQNTCFAILGSLLPGAYVMFTAIIFANLAHYAVTVSFQKMVVARLDVPEVSQKHATSKIGHGIAHVLEKCMFLRRGDPQLAVTF